MNNSADDLLEQLGGLGSGRGATPAARKNDKKTASNLQSTEKMDQWRILLVDLIYLLNASFRDAHYWEGVKTAKDTFQQFVNILHELKQMPDQDGIVKIVFRGSPGTKLDSKSDYVIRFGKLNVDIQAISAVIKRMGIRLKHIEGRLTKAFEVLSAQGIETIFLRIPDSSDDELEKMRICLRIVSCYKKAVSDDIAIEYTQNGDEHSVRPMLNEAHQPDPNLTMLAALNDLTPDKLTEIVQKVSALMKQPDFARSGIQSANAYQTIFNIKSLRQRLKRPLIEINSARSAQGMTDQQSKSGAAAGKGSGAEGSVAEPAATQGTGGGGQSSGPGEAQGSGEGGEPAGPGAGQDSGDPGSIPPAAVDPAVLRANITKFVEEAYRDSPDKAGQVMNSIYSDDYRQLDPTGLERRLNLITDLLTTLQKNEQGQQFMDAVVQQIQAGVDQIPKDVLDDLIVQDDVVKIWDGEDEKIIGSADENISDIIETSKERADTRLKMRADLRPDAGFTDEDVDQLSETFDISVNEAREIAKLFRACFDAHGNFQRALFEKKIPELVQYQKRIFEILWEFLRETPRRNDRLPFLNSLQLLVKEIQQPTQAIKVLLADFLVDPAEVNYPDRNAMMLAIQFLRTYNKEINMDIEITPEEVLLVQVGMDPRVRNYALWKVDGEQKKFVKKVITIRKKLLASFEQEGSDENLMPIRFLLALEREVHMFLALIGGATTAAVIQSALKVYGNPASQIYRLEKSRQYTSSLLQHLAVLIRSMGRVGQPADIALLDDIQSRHETFLGLSEEPRHAAQIRRTMGWIDAAKREISGRTV